MTAQQSKSAQEKLTPTHQAHSHSHGTHEHDDCCAEHAKIGRNDPCSCGSGKKYKKCCLHNSHE